MSEAEQQMVDFYRLQANAGINLIGGLLNTGLGAVAEIGGTINGGLTPLQTMRQAGAEIVRLPTFELQSEYFRGARGEVLQVAADVGAGVIVGGACALGGAKFYPPTTNLAVAAEHLSPVQTSETVSEQRGRFAFLCREKCLTQAFPVCYRL